MAERASPGVMAAAEGAEGAEGVQAAAEGVKAAQRPLPMKSPSPHRHTLRD